MPSYTSLPKGSVRLLRLLPNSDQNSPIECRLITFSMLDSGSTHPYESLSYVWGSDNNKQAIYVDDDELYVTANLHVALSHLRHCLLERILWVDAICINQGDNDEKGRQIQLMAKIYSKASRVIVWLGEAADGSKQALETIRAAADEQTANPLVDKINWEAILTLLERGWFERIWVLQEIAAARHVLIKCGTTEIDGYAFCSGLSALNPPYETRPHLLGLIPPIVYLIRGAIFRLRYEGDETSRQDRFSLGIRPLGQLVDMYHTHKATVPLDKVYALLGMSNDDPHAAGLNANYEVTWGEVFRALIYFCLSNQMIVSTWNGVEAAVIEAKGYILGEVSSAGEDVTRHDRQNQNITRHDRQHGDITWKNAPSYFDKGGGQSSPFTFQASVKAVKQGDVVCLLKGASRPTIVRLCDGFSTIIMIAIPMTDNLQKWSASVTTFPTDLLLVWDWDESRRESQGGEDYGKLISSREIPKCSVVKCQCLHDLDKATRLCNFGLLLNRMERYKEAIKNLRKAVEVYRSREGLGSVDETYLGHGSWREVDEEVLRIMDDLLIDDKSANIEAKYKEHSQTPLSWAAEVGHEAAVRLLIDKSVSVEAKDNSGRTPLSWAAGKGHEAVVRLLINEGAGIELEDNSGRTPLSWAAGKGYEAVVRLLIDEGAGIELEDNSGWTPLLWAAVNGYETVVRLLIDKGASIEAPLSKAAEGGYEAVVRLFIDKGASVKAKDHYGRTPLSKAAEGGHEAVVRLLIEKGASVEANDQNSQTPLSQAARGGHEAVVRLLIEKGANVEAKCLWGFTPLSEAAGEGHEAVVRLLIEKGAIVEAKDQWDQTPLSKAAKGGHEAAVRLLIDKGASVEAKDWHGQTPLLVAAEVGHEAVVRLLESYAVRSS